MDAENALDQDGQQAAGADATIALVKASLEAHNSPGGSRRSGHPPRARRAVRPA